MNESRIPQVESSTAPPVRVTYRRNADEAPAAVPRHVVLEVPAALAPVARDPAVARLRLLVRDEAPGWAMPVDADEVPIGPVVHAPLDDGREGFVALLVKRAALPLARAVDVEATATALAAALVAEVA